MILNAPEAKIRSAGMGLVQVSGLAESPYVMLSPLNHTECYYYRSIAWQLRRQGQDNHWAKIAEETLYVPFYLNDGTGKALVDPRGADIDLQCAFQQEYHRSLPLAGPDMPGGVAEFLSRHSIDPNTGIKVEEYCIKPKNLLFALGTLSQNPGLDISIIPTWAQRIGEKQRDRKRIGDNTSEGVRTLTHVVRLSEPDLAVPATAMTQQQKIAAALSRAGVSNPSAWNSRVVRPEAASSAVAVETVIEAESQSGADEPEGFDLHPPVVLMKGNHRPEFLISWRSPRELVKSMQWNSYLMTCGGAVLTLTCIYLIVHFHWL
jgi:E3 Ubiquitin ligase